MFMPFGKHKGQPVSEIPSDYLAWLIQKVRLRPILRDLVVSTLRGRGVPAPTERVTVRSRNLGTGECHYTTTDVPLW